MAAAGICLALCFTALSTAGATGDGSHRRERGCPRTLLRCPLRLERPHGLIPGLNEDWHARPEDLAYAARAGARVVRFPLAWATVQPNGPDEWNWDAYDAVLADARALGLGVILEPYAAPCWAHPKEGCSPNAGPMPPDPNYEPQWEEFIRRLVARYGDVTAIEVWNEPNLGCFWSSGPDAAEYTFLLKGAYRASKSARPELPVLFGGMAPPEEESGEQGYLGFLREAYDAGAAGYFDALAVHPYPLSFDRADYRERVLSLIARARRIASRRQGVEMPIWVTEIGIPSAGPDSVSEAEQASRLDALYRLLARVPRLPVVVIHRAFDQPGSGDWENGFGLLRSDLSPKPAFEAIQRDFEVFSRLPNNEPGCLRAPSRWR